MIQHKMDGVFPIQQVAYHVTSSALPANMSMPTSDLRHDPYSDKFSRFNGSTEGSTFGGASTVVSPINRMNILSPLGKIQAGNMVLSPEQNSTVTSCSSGDGFSDTGTFNYGPVFDSTVQILHPFQIIPEVPNTLPSTDMEYQWPYEQFDKPSNGKAQLYFNERNVSCSSIAEQVMCTQTLSPSEPSYGFPLTSESSALTFNSTGATKSEKNSNLSCFSLEHRILCDYINYKSPMVVNGGSIVPFLNYLHSTICNIHWCGCEFFCLLLSHFDGCYSSECHICGPVRYVSDAANRQKFDVSKRRFSDRDYGWSESGSTKCLLPSSKRLKMEHPIFPFSSGVGISSFVDPLQVQSFDFGAVLPSRQWPESPKSINSEVRKVDMELLRNPVNESTTVEGSMNSVADSHCMLNSKKVFTSELNFGSSMEKNLGSGSDIAEIFLDCKRLRSRVEPVREEHGADCKEDKILARTKLNPTNPEIPNEFVAEPVRSDLCVTKFGTKYEFIAQEVDTRKQIKSRNPRTNGVFLTDLFTAEELRVHISSLRQSVSQSASKEEKENTTTNTVSENTCQLCLADKLSLAPTPIYCSSCGAHIKRDVIYYSTPEENGMRHCFCTSCYKQSRGGKITVCGISISKAKMYKRKNDEAIEEAWVLCDKCQGWQHQICALFNTKIDTEGKAEYICPKCRLKEIEIRGYSLLAEGTCFSAKDLPRTLLSDHLEQRLIKCLQEERKKKASASGKNLDEVPMAEGLTVRVVLSVDKQVKVKQQFLDIFHEDNYPTEFPYRLKVILLFQKIEGVDVCLFGMYVQEFGSECGPPNQNCVYISYLDSVKYFRPDTESVAGKALRTFVYHEILIGYLEFCKKRGFATCYIWACPPVKGEDYILYCHPETQKTPKSDKLRHWYRSMLRKASEEKIVVGISNLYDQFFIPTGQHSKVTAARLPYFDGDYWSGAAERVIKSIEQDSGDGFHKKLKKPMTKRTLKAMGHADPSSNEAKDILLMQKLGQSISSVKEDFIIVRLQYVCSHCHEVILYGQRWLCSQCKDFQLCESCHGAEKDLNGEDVHTLNGKEKHALNKVMVDDVPCHNKDKDFIIDNSLFENRNDFLSFCQKNYYQFDTLRRAKHSSMMILHHLHNSNMLNTESICRFCHKDTERDQCWQCEMCPQFEVCTACYQEKGDSLHVHKLTRHCSAANAETKSKVAQMKEVQAGRNSNMLITESICCFCHKDTERDQCWQCEMCPLFEVCTTCYQEKGDSLHVHKLTWHSSAANAGTESKVAQMKMQAGRNSDILIHPEPQVNLMLQTQLMDLLQHASQCCSTKSQACSYPRCFQMKKYFYHARDCNIRIAGGCQHCKKLWSILDRHSRSCKEPDCKVPRCRDIKQRRCQLS